jgi:hypothetical protein
MKTKAACPENTLAASVAGEDLCVGDDVAILNEIHEFPSFFWSGCETSVAPHEPVRIQSMARDAGTPLRVQAVCLPFVFLKTPIGKPRTVDIRRVQLVRLDASYARLVRKELRRKRPRRTPPPPSC